MKKRQIKKIIKSSAAYSKTHHQTKAMARAPRKTSAKNSRNR
ncbi:hypothetical protein [Desulfuribacillus alkaliarsenatis]|nr:hypothetical protein [Desulfuribacillus alkaliarsenatis]